MTHLAHSSGNSLMSEVSFSYLVRLLWNQSLTFCPDLPIPSLSCPTKRPSLLLGIGLWILLHSIMSILCSEEKVGAHLALFAPPYTLSSLSSCSGHSVLSPSSHLSLFFHSFDVIPLTLTLLYHLSLCPDHLFNTPLLHSITSFNLAISGNLARSVSDMTVTILVDMANITLIQRDAYLATVRYGIKEDTLLALRTSPIHTDRLFDEELIKKADAELSAHEAVRTNRGRERPQSASFTPRAGPVASQSPTRQPNPSSGSNRNCVSGPRNARKHPRKPDAQSGQTKPSFKGGKGFSYKCDFEARPKK